MLILADALQKFNTDLHTITGLHMLRAISLPQLSFAGLFLQHGMEIPLITYPVQYEKCRDACKGGVNIVSKRVAEVKNSLRERIIHIDMKSMYQSAMMGALPCANYQWEVKPSCERLKEMLTNTNLEKKGALATCDILFPIDTHDNLNDFPPLFERRTFEPVQYPQRYDYYQKRQTVKKLIPHLGPVQDYTCTLQELIIITNLEGQITRVASILTFDCVPFVKGYLETLRNLRQKAINVGNTPLSTFILINNECDLWQILSRRI